jgi:hypothetical protein
MKRLREQHCRRYDKRGTVGAVVVLFQRRIHQLALIAIGALMTTDQAVERARSM